jgi:RNA polymerase sigma-70 factor, ECF subfamily
MQEGLAGNAASYRLLLTELGRLLRAHFLRRLGQDHVSDAEDLVQETLMAVHARRATFDEKLLFTPWLYGIARYKLADRFRRDGSARFVPIDETDEIFLSTGEGAAVEAHIDTERLLATLPLRSRRIMRQIKLEGRSIDEVAHDSGMSPSAVKVTLHRALKALGRKFAGAGQIDDDA